MINYNCYSITDIEKILSIKYGITPTKIERIQGFSHGRQLVQNGGSASMKLIPDNRAIPGTSPITWTLKDTQFIGQWELSFYHYSNPLLDYEMYLTAEQVSDFDLQGDLYNLDEITMVRYDSDQILASSFGSVWPSVKRNEVWAIMPQNAMNHLIGPYVDFVLKTTGAGSQLALDYTASFNGFRFYLR